MDGDNRQVLHSHPKLKPKPKPKKKCQRNYGLPPFACENAVEIVEPAASAYKSPN